MFVYHGNEVIDEVSAVKKDEEYEYSLVPFITISLLLVPSSRHLFTSILSSSFIIPLPSKLPFSHNSSISLSRNDSYCDGE